MSLELAIEKAKEFGEVRKTLGTNHVRTHELSTEIDMLAGNWVYRDKVKHMTWPKEVCDAAGLCHNSIRRVRGSDR